MVSTEIQPFGLEVDARILQSSEEKKCKSLMNTETEEV